MRRVMIIGQPGAGKSTLARQIGAVTGLPVVHMDQIHWKSGWIERSADEKLRLAAAAHAQPEWVFEGGFSRTWHERMARADTLIWLDLPLPLRAFRVARRTLSDYGRTRPDLPDGCPERFDLTFWRWIWDTRTTGRAFGLRIVADPPPHLTLHHLRSPAAVAHLLARIERSCQTAGKGAGTRP